MTFFIALPLLARTGVLEAALLRLLAGLSDKVPGEASRALTGEVDVSDICSDDATCCVVAVGSFPWLCILT